ncbi:Vacuolar protease A [Xylographa pallens]|nr:Vacuolar protease A [Xylographa pallens]
MLALLSICNGLPRLLEFFKPLQVPIGNNQNFQRQWWARMFSLKKASQAYSTAPKTVTIEDNNGWFYYTDIGIGTPPQSFRAVIDIGWSDSFVPSVDCTELVCSHHHRYDHAQSTSYRANGTAVHLHHSGFYTSGYASVDSFRIAGLTIKNQAFEEAILLKPVPLWDDVFDTVLGLPRLQVEDPESSLRAVSTFHEIIRQELLQKNLFSLKLSDTDANERGELLFGEVNTDLYDGVLTSFPVSEIYSNNRRAGVYLSPGWQVDVHSIAYGDQDGEIANFSLAGYAAGFSTVYPYISLPRAIGEEIIQYLGADLVNLIDCDRRDAMPDLIFGLGHKATPLVLKPKDYIRTNPQWHWSTTCQVEIAVHDEPEDGAKYIVLGSVFLARWYSVFDYDNAQISLASLKKKT